MDTLQGIVEEILTRDGLSARQLDARARKLGHSLTYTTINAIRNGTHDGRYQPRTLDAIAVAGAIPRKRVYAAADLPLPDKPFAEELPGDVDYLDRASRRAVLGVIRVFLDQRSPTRSPGAIPVTPTQNDYEPAAEGRPGNDEADYNA